MTLQNVCVTSNNKNLNERGPRRSNNSQENQKQKQNVNFTKKMHLNMRTA